ncbi:MAG: hypothetical protein WCF64_02680, partial [Methylocella sp.]
ELGFEFADTCRQKLDLPRQCRNRLRLHQNQADQRFLVQRFKRFAIHPELESAAAPLVKIVSRGNARRTPESGGEQLPFKAEFLDPLKILGSSTPTKEAVARKVSTKLNCQFGERDVDGIFLTLFSGLGDDVIRPQGELNAAIVLALASNVASASRQLASNGYLRTQFTADLVSEFISGVELQFDEKHPVLSSVKLKDTVARKVETLKHYTYETTIMASRLRVQEQRGFDIISKLFDKLDSPKGYMLLPEDYRNLYESLSNNDAAKKRVVCDFIAGMTDRYAVEFYSRIFSDSPQSIFKPL